MFYPEEKSAFEIHDSCIDILTKNVQTETENVNVCFYCEKREEEKERKLQRGPRARQPSFSNIQKYTHRFLRNIWRERERFSRFSVLSVVLIVGNGKLLFIGITL